MLLVVLSVFPSSTNIDTPFSVPDKMVRDWFNSILYHVMVGLGLAIALQLNVTKPGWVTLKSLSVRNSILGGTIRCIYIYYIDIMLL